MRFEDLGLITLSPVCTSKSLSGSNPVVFFSTNCAPPTCMLSPRDPPKVVFHRETVTIWTQVGHCNSSLSSHWRNDASEAVSASDHEFLHDAQLSCLILCYLLERFPSFCRMPILWLLLHSTLKVLLCSSQSPLFRTIKHCFVILSVQ